MRTFYISTLGCKVNHYESEQLAVLLRRRGLVQVNRPDAADLRLVNTCSVTVQAAGKSRRAVRHLHRLSLPQLPVASIGPAVAGRSRSQRIIVTGCWATSDRAQAAALPGVSAVLGHHDNVAEQLDRLLAVWQTEDQPSTAQPPTTVSTTCQPPPEPFRNDGLMIQAGSPAAQLTEYSKAQAGGQVKKNPAQKHAVTLALRSRGTAALPQLDRRQPRQQRAYLKIQDGCDAHCTYCIIPALRPVLWSRSVSQVTEEARRLVAAGHGELVLTGIFLGAYGQGTALRRRQTGPPGRALAGLIDALCSEVPGLRRLRLSSLESGDLGEELLAALRAWPQVMPHFHLPLQSGSDPLLRRMNRQYTREQFLSMVARLRGAFDRPAFTTDIIVGFPGETDRCFEQTLDVVDRVGFIHIHAFAFSPRPGTAAARWTRDFVPGAIVARRIAALRERAARHSLAFRRTFLGQTVEVMVERPSPEAPAEPLLQHGRCERYFSVCFEHRAALVGRCVRVRVDRVTGDRTMGTLVGTEPGADS